MQNATDLLFLIHDLSRMMRVEVDRRAGETGATRAYWSTLIWLERQPGLSQKELAERLEVEPISVARLLDRLEARGVVERRPDPRDRRVWRLHLRPAAGPILQEIAQQRQELRQMVCGQMDAAAIAAAAETLAQMKANMCAIRLSADRSAATPMPDPAPIADRAVVETLPTKENA